MDMVLPEEDGPPSPVDAKVQPPTPVAPRSMVKLPSVVSIVNEASGVPASASHPAVRVHACVLAVVFGAAQTISAYGLDCPMVPVSAVPWNVSVKAPVVI